jgi:hypothetical protein
MRVFSSLAMSFVEEVDEWLGCDIICAQIIYN